MSMVMPHLMGAMSAVLPVGMANAGSDRGTGHAAAAAAASLSAWALGGAAGRGGSDVDALVESCSRAIGNILRSVAEMEAQGHVDPEARWGGGRGGVRLGCFARIWQRQVEGRDTVLEPKPMTHDTRVSVKPTLLILPHIGWKHALQEAHPSVSRQLNAGAAAGHADPGAAARRRRSCGGPGGPGAGV